MLTIKNVNTLDGQMTDFQIPSIKVQTLDVKGKLLLLPGIVDPHICLGNPMQKNWSFAIESALRGGITTVIDIPTPNNPSDSKDNLENKRKLVDKQLAELKIPLHMQFYFDATSEHPEQLGIAKSLILGTLMLLTPEHHLISERVWEKIFQLAAWEDLPVVINSQNENAWQDARFKNRDETLLEKALFYAEKENTRLYVMNVATVEEIKRIEEAREKSLLIYSETTPQHLFPKNSSEADFLWEALNRGVIETIGSGFHIDAKEHDHLLFHGGNFHFLDPMFLLPLLLTAHHEGKISLEKIVQITRTNAFDVFKLDMNQDVTLIDMEHEEVVQRTDREQSVELKLKGWPVYTVLKGHVFEVPKSGYHMAEIE